MTSLDDKLVPKVYALLEKLGKRVQFESVSAGTYDPATRTTTNKSVLTFTRKVTPPSSFEDKLVNGDTIRATDLKVYTAAQGIPRVPKNVDQVTVDGITYKITVVKPIYSGEQVCLYMMGLRK